MSVVLVIDPEETWKAVIMSWGLTSVAAIEVIYILKF